jgi:predicted ribonuclease YlaK
MNNSNKLVSIEERSGNIKHVDIKVSARPITENHKKAIDGFLNGKNLILEGCPGTGKTFISLNMSIQKILEGSEYERVMIVRSIVPVRDIGFLKGSEEEKCAAYESPYLNICTETFDSSAVVYEKLKKQGVIEFQPTSFNQGITLHRTLIVVDEAQNMNYAELFNIFTRMGNHSRIFFCGDYKKQNMLNKNRRDESGFERLINVINSHEKLKNQFVHVEMTKDDIVRDEIVKDFIEADFEYDENNK